MRITREALDKMREVHKKASKLTTDTELHVVEPFVAGHVVTLCFAKKTGICYEASLTADEARELVAEVSKALAGQEGAG